MTSDGYNSMDDAPRFEAAYFLMSDGREVIGHYEPYWCGSDCPCDVAGEGLEPLDEEPDCWGVYPIVGGRVTKYALNDEPTGWRPL